MAGDMVTQTIVAPKLEEQQDRSDSTSPPEATTSNDDTGAKPSSVALVEESPAPSDNGDATTSTSKDTPEESVAVDNEEKATSTYRDYSHIKPEEGESGVLLSPNKEPTFIVKLHQMLSNPEIDDIISWLPHGRAWRILQRKAFEEQVIPLYFRHCRYSSFMRQVNGWGFQRICHGPDYNAYYHEIFLRGMPHLCHKMRRLTKRDKEEATAKGRQSMEGEVQELAPDFYKISEENPLPDASFVPQPPLPTIHGRISDAAMMRDHGMMGVGAGQSAMMGFGLHGAGMFPNHFGAGFQAADLDMARHQQMMVNGMQGAQSAAFGGLGMHPSSYPSMAGSQMYGLPPSAGMAYMNTAPHPTVPMPGMDGNQQLHMAQLGMAEQQRATDASYINGTKDAISSSQDPA